MDYDMPPRPSDRTKLSPYKRHLAKWDGCQACFLAATRHRMVFARGVLPCDVLFIGEAPGTSEDVLGQPFVGEAGKELDDQIEAAGEEAGCLPRLAWTNLVCCIPINEDGKQEPAAECLKACRPRLEELIDLANPDYIVQVGKLAAKHAPPRANVSYAEILHPAYILRADPVGRDLLRQRVIVTLADVFSEFLPQS